MVAGEGAYAIRAMAGGDGGRFNPRMGILGLVIGVVATVSYTVSGAIATSLGTPTAFMALALAGICAVMTVGFAMPETRPLPAGAWPRPGRR